ncbi:HVA22-like protein a isoform X2 [Panicum virgatum]|uniref:HVA22-like protein a isoform X2 n=1 Tax=Panicum virgatum TaxID=38727 RepID=UPI0019D55ED1|nr:HVA22-like protein a isoform X2 [Panicum virgatum]
MGGGGSGSFLKVLVNNLDVLAGPLVSLAYPLYASVRAIETKSAVDGQQWLTYWVLYSFITLFELTFAPVLEWLPFWSYAKLFFNCWLVLPQFNGAAHVYEHFVRPMIEQNGSKAFENLVNKFKSSNPRRSILEEVEVERRARIQRESEAREVNPFFNPDY